MMTVQTEEALKPILRRISYLAKGKEFGTAEVRFWKVAIARIAIARNTVEKH